MGKPLSRPGCFRKSSCCLEKHGAGDGRVGGRGGGVEGGYGDGYVPQRSIYDTMCINQQIDSHHHHPGGSIRRDICGEANFSYSASGSLRVSRGPGDMFDPQPRSLTPNPSFVRRLDERAIYDSLKLGGHDINGGSCHSPGHFTRSVSPSVSSFSAPGVSSSSKKHHHHHHHHGDSTKSRDGRHSWKVLTPPQHIECLELTTTEMIDRGGGYLNPGQYPPPGGQSSSLASPLISPFSGSPLSSGYHTPVFFSPAKPRSSQSQSLRCSPPQVVQPRHYSQTQSLRLSPPHELRRSPYRGPLVQLSAHDLEQDLRDRGGGWGRSEREREWEREREREMERGWAQREWERERERGRIERERARERERRETSFGTFGYGRPVPLHSDRDSVFLEHDQGLDTTPLLLPQPSPSPSPSPNAAPRMGTCAVGRNRAGSKIGLEGGGMVSKFDNGSVGMVLVDSKSGCGPRLVNEVSVGNMSEAEIRAGMQEHHRTESWSKSERASRTSVKNGCEIRMGPKVKTRPGGRDLEGKVQSGAEIEHFGPAIKEGHRGSSKGREKNVRGMPKPEVIAEVGPSVPEDIEDMTMPGNEFEIGVGSDSRMMAEFHTEFEVGSKQMEDRAGREAQAEGRVNEVGSEAESKVDAGGATEVMTVFTYEPEAVLEPRVVDETKNTIDVGTEIDTEPQNSIITMDTDQISVTTAHTPEDADHAEKSPVDTDKTDSSHKEKSSRSQKSKSSKSSGRTRPGTATGLRPGVVSPKLSRGLGDLESPSPTEGIESTWPRRMMVRKRTVRQGGALHNLPILPPLPSVLSALEKRRPHALLHARTGHFSENPLSSIINASSIVGRCSLKEPSNSDSAQVLAGLVGRASLKEQNLEHWRVCRELEEPRRSRSKEKHGEQSKERTEKERTEKETTRNKDEKKKEKSEEINIEEKRMNKEKEKVLVSEELLVETKQETRMDEVKVPAHTTIEVRDVEVISKKLEGKDATITIGIQEPRQHHLEVGKLETDDVETEGGEGGTPGEEGGAESWDDVLQMVNTLWDEGWDKGRAEGEGDTDSLSGSLPHWPLLRPPVGFGGSHPPSSAASELSLTELERRARELDSDLEHLDLSQPHKDTQDVYQTPAGTEMYQTHPGPQREKGGGTRFQVNLELTSVSSPATDTDRPVEWSDQSAGTSTVCTSSTKEDSSPDSNLTLESDSSGVFLSLSNQSQEEVGSDSDQPVSGSDLGSSTSLEKDGDDGGLKEWGREESAELQWCYPSLLDASSHEDIEGYGGKEEGDCTVMEGNEEKGNNESNRDNSIMKSSTHRADFEVSSSRSQETPPRKKVTLMGGKSLLPLSPSKPVQHFVGPNQKPTRTSGLDCGDIDPFVQSDSFVYLAVSARPASQVDGTTVTEFPTHETKQEPIRSRLDDRKHTSNSMKRHLNMSTPEQDAKPSHLVPQKPEEGDFLCTDSFVYLAAPACLMLGPAGTTSYSGRESDSESSGSGGADVSVLGCGSVAGDSDWDSDQSDSDPSRATRFSAVGDKSGGGSRTKRLPTEPVWDMYGEVTDPEEPGEFFTEHDRNNNGKVSGVSACRAASPGIPMAPQPLPSPVMTSSSSAAAAAEQSTKKVTWQFKPAQRSVCTGSRKEKELGGGETHRPPPLSSSSSSSSPSSSSSG